MGLEGYCQHYEDCGGTYYASAQDCVDKSNTYWGSCSSRQSLLDAYGNCMLALSCADWNPNADSPTAGPCAQQYSDLWHSAACQ